MSPMSTLPEELKSYLQAHDLAQPAAFANEPQVGVQLALTRVIDLVTSSFAELAEQASGREVLWNGAREASETDPPATGSRPNSGSLAVAPSHGAGLVKSVLDDRYHGTVNTIATAAGVQTASITRLIDVVTSAALDVLGSQVAAHQWSAQELGQWLRSQPAAAPAPVSTPLLDLDLDRAAAAAPGGARATPATSAATGGVGAWLGQRSNALLLAVSLIAVAEFGYIMGTRHGVADEGVAVTPAPTPPSAANAGAGASRQYAAIPVTNLSVATGGRAKAAVPVMLKLKNGLRQIIGANSTESKLYQFLVDPSKEVDAVDPTKGWIGFDRIYFEPNKAVLTNESLWQLSNVALILKRFPAAKVKIGGYTDSSGQPLTNLRLSQARAKAAMTTLTGLGVPADHLSAAGYGALDNIAPNDTEESRALNRRVSLQVVQK